MKIGTSQGKYDQSSAFLAGTVGILLAAYFLRAVKVTLLFDLHPGSRFAQHLSKRLEDSV
jgi:hypothetical protein